MKKKNFVLMFFMLVLLLTLTSCSSKEITSGDDAITYMPEFVSVSINYDQLDDWCILGDTIYIRCRAEYGRDFPPSILRISTNDGKAELLPEYQPPTPNQNDSQTVFQYSTIVCSLQADPDGTLWESSQLIVCYIEGIDYWEKNVPILRHLDKEGKELSRLDFPSDLEENLGLGYLRKFIVAADGAIYAQCDNGIALLDNSGNCIFSVVPDGVNLLEYGTVVALSNGQIGVLFADYNSAERSYINTLRTINSEVQEWGTSFHLGGGDAVRVFNGDETALFYYKTGDTLCAWREDAEASEQVVSLLDADINSTELYAVAEQSNGQFVLLTASNPFAAPINVQVVKLRPVKISQMEKKTLNFATIGLSSKLRQQILEFNRKSPEYRISVKDYSQYGGYNAALARLATEIGAGKAPDLLATYDLPIDQWAAKGFLEDLNPYLNADPDVNRDMLMSRVLDVSEIDGKLYEIASSFWISTLIGEKSIVGDRMTWTGQEMNDALETMPDGCIPFPYRDKTDLLNAMIIWPRLVDWEKGTCHFESEEFRSLLEFCSNMPDYTVQDEYNENSAILDKQQMLINRTIMGFGSLVQAETLLGGEIACIGYPNVWGDIGSRFHMAGGVAMSSTCKEKDGAWSFLRTLLLPQAESLDVSSSFGGFPINKADFTDMAEAAMGKPDYAVNDDGEVLQDSNGEKFYMPIIEKVLKEAL